MPFVFALQGILLSPLSLHGQYENFWAFGNNAGVDFNRNPPEAIQTSINTNEGCASICDAYGQLLFYTDGTSLWDRNNVLMPNGNDLPGRVTNITRSTSQGALIVPVPGDAEQYYVFSLGNWEHSTYFGRLYYSVVDMTLNNGMGDVVPGKKGILLDSFLTEHMTAVSGNDCNIWLIAVSRLNNSFKAYNIQPNGIDLPMISPGTPANISLDRDSFNQLNGNIEVSPDRSRLVIPQAKVILYDFDPGTGRVARPIILGMIIDSTINTNPSANDAFYGVAFSPDNTKLYISKFKRSITGSPTYQFDLSAGDSLAIVASKTIINDSVQVFAMKRGPDGKIYCSMPNSDAEYLCVINQPNLAGAACDFTIRGLKLLPGTKSVIGLPNAGTFFTNKKVYTSRIDSTRCAAPRLLEAANRSGLNYIWQDGTTGPEKTVSSAGLYWVRYQVQEYVSGSPCQFTDHIDTFRVVFRFNTQHIHRTVTDSGMCKTDTLLLQAGNPNGVNYTWDDGSSKTERKINQPGTYWVRYDIDSLCEHYADTFIISYPQEDFRVSFQADTFVCQDKLISFVNTAHPYFNDFSWSFGDGNSSIVVNPEHTYVQTGMYNVQLVGKIGDICPDTAYHTVIVDAVLSGGFRMEPSAMCVGESLTLYPQTDSSVRQLQWHFGDGNEMASGNEREVYHAYDVPSIHAVALFTKFRACPDAVFTDTIHVYSLPKIAMGNDTGLCFKGTAIVLKNLQPPLSAVYSNLWNTGDTTESIKVTSPGIYSLTVRTEPAGCSATEYITIHKDCYIDIPNAFTPNGDGINDYFFPRQLLSKSVVRFHVQIFNRWGELLFETIQADGHGWDGRWKGKAQPSGVYLYRIEVMTGDTADTYQGNVTLIR